MGGNNKNNNGNRSDQRTVDPGKYIDTEREFYLATVLRTGIAKNKGIVDGLTDFIPVSVFIAGVQAQIISFTISLVKPERDPIIVAANWFGFNGLVLDILGSVFASAHLIALKKYIRGAERNLLLMKSNSKALQDLIRRINAHPQDNPASSRALVEALSGQQKVCLDEIEKLYQSWLVDPTPKSVGEWLLAPFRVIRLAYGFLIVIPSSYQSIAIELHPRLKAMISAIQRLGRWITRAPSYGSPDDEGDSEPIIMPPYAPPRAEDTKGPHPSHESPDHLPFLLMELGIIFLLLSVILQTVATQLRRVWVGCVFFTAFGYLYLMPVLHLLRSPYAIKSKSIADELGEVHRRIHHGAKFQEMYQPYLVRHSTVLTEPAHRFPANNLQLELGIPARDTPGLGFPRSPSSWVMSSVSRQDSFIKSCA